MRFQRRLGHSGTRQGALALRGDAAGGRGRRRRRRGSGSLPCLCSDLTEKEASEAGSLRLARHTGASGAQLPGAISVRLESGGAPEPGACSPRLRRTGEGGDIVPPVASALFGSASSPATWKGARPGSVNQPGRSFLLASESFRGHLWREGCAAVRLPKFPAKNHFRATSARAGWRAGGRQVKSTREAGIRAPKPGKLWKPGKDQLENARSERVVNPVRSSSPLSAGAFCRISSGKPWVSLG